MSAKRIFKLVTGLLLTGILGLGNVVADTLEIKGDAPQTYTVVKGDTLWDISGRYLEKPWRWPELWEGNPQIADPHLIYPGDVLTLDYIDGQPRLGIKRARPNVKLSPKVRATRLDSAIPVVPVEAIRQFLTEMSVLDKASMEQAPYVVSGGDERLRAASYDIAYVKGLDAARNSKYQIYHLGDPINDPSTGEVIAHEGFMVANAKVRNAGDPATVLLTRANREAKVGDRLVAYEDDGIITNFYPKVPEGKLNGQVLNLLDGLQNYGRFNAVIINLGKTDGVERGHVFSIFNKGATIEDKVTADPKDTVTLPSERAGTVMVIEAFENLSYALVMESRLPMKILDEVRTPE